MDLKNRDWMMGSLTAPLGEPSSEGMNERKAALGNEVGSFMLWCRALVGLTFQALG